MRALLIYPPAVDPRAPQLALPSLTAVLRPAGVETQMFDLALEGVEGLLRPDRLARAAAAVRAKAPLDLEDSLGRLGALSEEVAARAPAALGVLRDARFFDAGEYNTARDLLAAALDLHSAAAPSGVEFNVTPIRYDVRGVDPTRLEDLLRVTADRGANVFAEHWEEDVFPRLDRAPPDLVGITITNRQQILPGLTLARALKARGHFVVLGGAVYTKFQSELASRPDFFRTFADGVVVYEGETAILELCHQLQNQRDFSRVPNYLYLDRDQVRVTPIHAENVERLPTPDFEGLPIGNYLAPAPVLPILTGKGCYFNRCKFCDIPYINHIADKAYRRRSPERIAEDVRALADRHGARHFVITDETLAPKLLEKLSVALAPHRHRRFRFTGYARLEEGFTPTVAARMAEMGFEKAFFGLESASQKMLDHMDKGTNVAAAPGILKNMRDAGIAFHLFSIVGLPEETLADSRETFQFFVDNQAVIDDPANSFDIHPFGLDLRTTYWEEREARGIDVAPEAIARDFVISLRGSEWRNARGITHEDAVQLIYADYLPRLRRSYRRWHNTYAQLYPGFEEYSVLYGDVWRGRAFPYETSLPERGDPRAFTVRINPSWKLRSEGARTRLVGRHATFELDPADLALLSDRRWPSVDALLEAGGSGREPALRELCFSLFEAGALQLRLEAPAVEAGVRLAV